MQQLCNFSYLIFDKFLWVSLIYSFILMKEDVEHLSVPESLIYLYVGLIFGMGLLIKQSLLRILFRIIVLGFILKIFALVSKIKSADFLFLYANTYLIYSLSSFMNVIYYLTVLSIFQILFSFRLNYLDAFVDENKEDLKIAYFVVIFVFNALLFLIHY